MVGNWRMEMNMYANFLKMNVDNDDDQLHTDDFEPQWHWEYMDFGPYKIARVTDDDGAHIMDWISHRIKSFVYIIPYDISANDVKDFQEKIKAVSPGKSECVVIWEGFDKFVEWMAGKDDCAFLYGAATLLESNVLKT